jgi:hypothetical protein
MGAFIPTRSDMWGEILTDSILRPRLAAKRVLALPLPPRAVVEAAVAVASLGVVLGFAAVRLAGGGIDPLSAAMLSRPLLGAAVQIAVMAGIAFLAWGIGARLGGRGDALGAAKVVVWLNAVTLVIQAFQLVARFMALATLLWLFWAFANFTAELHDFTSPFIVLGVTVLTAVGLVLGLALVATLLGVSPEGAP